MLLRERGETDCIRRRVSFLQESKWKKESKTFFFSLVSQSQNQSEVAQLCPTLCDPMDTRLLRPWDLLGKSTGVGCHFLLQGIFSTQGSEAGILHSRQFLYHLSHLGSLVLFCKIEWTDYANSLSLTAIDSFFFFTS